MMLFSSAVHAPTMFNTMFDGNSFVILIPPPGHRPRVPQALRVFSHTPMANPPSRRSRDVPRRPCCCNRATLSGRVLTLGDGTVMLLSSLLVSMLLLLLKIRVWLYHYHDYRYMGIMTAPGLRLKKSFCKIEVPTNLWMLSDTSL